MTEEGGEDAGAGARSSTIDFPYDQLQAKFKHAAWFGAVGSLTPARVAEYAVALRRHIDAPGTVEVRGTFRRTTKVTLYVNRESNLMMVDISGRFVSAWRLTDDQFAERDAPWPAVTKPRMHERHRGAWRRAQ